MNRASADRVISESFSRPTATPCTWRDDRDVYISEQQESLRASQIEPIKVKAVALEHYQQHFGADDTMRDYFAIAKHEDDWLLYSPDSGEFTKGFGKDPSKPLSTLGFSSNDALAEWLG